MVEIRFCNSKEIEKLRGFLDTDWKKGHILATNADLLKWQHLSTSNDQINFAIGYNTTNDEIVGILGFIPLSQYDYDLEDQKDIWLAIWKVKNEYKGLGVGIELLSFITNSYQPNSIAAIGINQEVKRLYKALKYKTGTLAHYYFLNPNVDNFQIAKVSTKPEKRNFRISEYRLSRITDITNYTGLAHRYHPFKSISFIKNRYINHPIYKYQLYGVFKDTIECILITRKITMNNSACMRIVDVYGNLANINTIESELVKLLTIENSEYIDCLNFGISQDIFTNLGFSVRENIIIPNYFEPFESRNVDIEFAYRSSYNDYVIFKGDSDQDRPN